MNMQILRIKRKRDQDPVKTLYFETSKRAKTVNNTIFIFAGTTENEYEIKPENTSPFCPNNTEKDGFIAEPFSDQRRFRVKQRKLYNDGDNEGQIIYEAEPEDLVTRNALSDITESTQVVADYVWDIYTPAIQQAVLASKSGILLFDDEFGTSESEGYDIADQDSNAEDWYANDYPDEDSVQGLEWEISTDEERAYRDEDEEYDGEYYGMESYSDE